MRIHYIMLFLDLSSGKQPSKAEVLSSVNETPKSIMNESAANPRLKMSCKWEVAIFGTAVRPPTTIYILYLFWQVTDQISRSAEVKPRTIEMTPEIDPRFSMNFDEI